MWFNCSDIKILTVLYLLLPTRQYTWTYYVPEGRRGFIHFAMYKGTAAADVLYLMCVLNSIKPLSLKTGGWLLFFSNNVQGSLLGAAQWHSSYCLVCASGSYSVPVQNNKNIQVCLFAGLVSAKMNRYRPALSVCCSERAQVVLRKSWVLLGSLYLYCSMGLALLADVAIFKHKRCSNIVCMGSSPCGAITKKEV